MIITIPEAVGWMGSVLYVIAYLLLSLKKLRADTILYHLLNVAGAAGLIVNAFYWKDHPSLAVNLVWLGIGLSAIIMIARGKRSHAG